MSGTVKTPEDIELIAEGGQLLNDILKRTAALVKPGINTLELSDFAEREIRNIGGRPSFLGYGPKKNPFPAALCTSVNDVVVHGIPAKDRVLKGGDIVSLDIGMEYRGRYTDTAVTVPVGTASPEAMKLIETAERALSEAIRVAKPGARMGDISFAIQSTAERAGFSVVRDLVGHGVGYGVHEDPPVPCFGRPHTGVVLKPGMVLAIEPMLCAGEYFLTYDQDGWTIRTRDGKLASHAEHTVAVTERGCRVLT